MRYVNGAITVDTWRVSSSIFDRMVSLVCSVVPYSTVVLTQEMTLGIPYGVYWGLGEMEHVHSIVLLDVTMDGCSYINGNVCISYNNAGVSWWGEFTLPTLLLFSIAWPSTMFDIFFSAAWWTECLDASGLQSMMFSQLQLTISIERCHFQSHTLPLVSNTSKQLHYSFTSSFCLSPVTKLRHAKDGRRSSWTGCHHLWTLVSLYAIRSPTHSLVLSSKTKLCKCFKRRCNRHQRWSYCSLQTSMPRQDGVQRLGYVKGQWLVNKGWSSSRILV